MIPNSSQGAHLEEKKKRRAAQLAKLLKGISFEKKIFFF